VAIVATNAQTAVATAGGQLCRQPAFRLASPAVGEGKGPAFFAAFLATLIQTSDVRQALIAGHANGAAVAASWDPEKALLDRQQLGAHIARAVTAPPAGRGRLALRIALGLAFFSLVLGFALFAAGGAL
jgi:fructose-1-phosphate kinase PfkB-like protein